MAKGLNTVVQFSLPFEGTRDRVRNAAVAGRVLLLASAKRAMVRFDICDLLIMRALKRCEMLGEALGGAAKGEWECTVTFNAKGFRPGGCIALTISEGRVFVHDIHWDQQP